MFTLKWPSRQRNSCVRINKQIIVWWLFGYEVHCFNEKISFPWKIDAKLRVQLIARYFGAAFNSVCISFKLIALLYCKSVDRIFTLTVHVSITKTYDGSFNSCVDIVNFSSFRFFLQLKTSYSWITTINSPPERALINQLITAQRLMMLRCKEVKVLETNKIFFSMNNQLVWP